MIISDVNKFVVMQSLKVLKYFTRLPILVSILFLSLHTFLCISKNEIVILISQTLYQQKSDVDTANKRLPYNFWKEVMTGRQRQGQRIWSLLWILGELPSNPVGNSCPSDKKPGAILLWTLVYQFLCVWKSKLLSFFLMEPY